MMAIGLLVGVTVSAQRGGGFGQFFGGGGYDAHARSHYPWEIARDSGLLLLSAYLIWQGRTRAALDNLLFPRSVTVPELDHSGV